MLLSILARLTNDEHRWQCLQTLRSKLSHYNLNSFDLICIIRLFSFDDDRRLQLIQFLLPYITSTIAIDDYMQLFDSNQTLEFRLFEQIHDKLDIRTYDDCQRLIERFSIRSIQKQVESIIGLHQAHLIDHEQTMRSLSTKSIVNHRSTTKLVDDPIQLIQSYRVNQFRCPMESSFDPYACVCVKQASIVNKFYRCVSCHATICPELAEQEPMIQSRLIRMMSTSSLSSTNSDDNIPQRTRSFMVAIKNTFERLKETSNY
jgi:hypothetical protein